MGAALVYLEEPIKDKELLDGGTTPADSTSSRYMRHGTCEMQGWRVNMEDAHLAVPELDEQTSLYGVFDGHGGRGVSRFVARELPGVIKETEGWKVKDYKAALEQTFLKLDDLLRADAGRKAVEELDRPDPDKPKRLLQVPRRMAEQFRRSRSVRASQDGEEEDDEAFAGLEDDYGMDFEELEGGEEEEQLDAEQEVDIDAALAQQPNGAAVDASTSPPAEEPETSGTHTADVENVAPAAEEVKKTTESPEAKQDEVAGDAGTDDEGAESEEDGGADDDVLVDPSKLTRSPNPEAQGCTAVVVLVLHGGPDGPKLICANAGDSRAMVSRLGKVVDLSEDHKPGNAGETARITKAGGYVEDMPGGARVMGDLNLSRAIGDLRYKQKPEIPAAEQIVTAFPDVWTVPLKPDEDEFLVLGCDGIWETNSNQDAVDHVRSRLLVREGSEETESPKLSAICAEVCDKGLCPSMDNSCDGKGCDNMTFMVVQLKPRIKGSPYKRSAAAVEGEEETPSKRLKEAETGAVETNSSAETPPPAAAAA